MARPSGLSSDDDDTDTDESSLSVSPRSRPAQETQLENDEELLAFAKSLGLDPQVDSDLLWVAREALDSPLPANWSAFVDPNGQLYFANLATEESSWSHPTDALFKELLALIKAVRAETPPASRERRMTVVQEHLLQVHKRASAQILDWSGPYQGEEGEYYYNRVLDYSSWESPVTEWEVDLTTRNRVLRICLQLEWSVNSDMFFLERNKTNADGVPFLEVPVPAEGSAPPRSPSSATSARSFCTARSGRSACSTRSPTPARRRHSSPGPALRGTTTAVSEVALAEAPKLPVQLHRHDSREASPCGGGDPNGTCMAQKVQAANALVDKEETPQPTNSSAASADHANGPVGESSTSDVEACAAKHPDLECATYGLAPDRQLHVFKGNETKDEEPTSATAEGEGSPGSANMLEITFGSTSPLQLPRFGT